MRAWMLVALWAGSALAAEPAPAPADRVLELAYQKEYAFLEAEKRALAERKAAVERENTTGLARAQGQLAATQSEVLALGQEAEQLAEALREAQQASEAARDGRVGVESLLAALDQGLAAYHFTLPEGTEPAKITAAFQRAAELLGERSGLRTEAGAFFLRDGRRVEGTLIHLGDVAVFGVAAEAAGALTPAGGGRFKLDPPGGEATARALAEGRTPAVLQLFLFESADQNFEVRAEKTFEVFMRGGGAIGWVIVGLGAFALLLVIARGLLLALAARNGGRRLLSAVEALVLKSDFPAARQLCAQAAGPTARVLDAVLRGVETPEDGAHNADRTEMERHVAERLVAEERRLDRFASAIGVAATVSPLLGLLGTVTGMISTFDVITEFGTSNPKLLSGGISEALITTELGLLVAIPALLLGSLLASVAAGQKSHLEERALRLMNVVRVGALDDDRAPPGPAAEEAPPTRRPLALQKAGGG